MKMDRNTDVCNIKVTSNDGVNPEDSDLTKPGAKDGLSGTNDTSPFEPSAKITGPFGGSNKQ